ncbi:hypothetical protein JCM11641_004785 [Rhodosporidiobolus odoratus]
MILRFTRPAHLGRPVKRCRLPSISHFYSTSTPQSPALDLVPAPPYNVLFLGADRFSCEVLAKLYEARQGLIHSLTVVTMPDRSTGRRSLEVYRPPIRELCSDLNINCLPLPRDTLLKGWKPPPPFRFRSSTTSAATPSPHNLLVTASFGHLIPNSLLSSFLPLNTFNVHPSMLPKYRGSSPIQYSIANGDADEGGAGMGVSVQELSRGKFDQGRILGQKQVSVQPNRDFRQLEPLLAREGGDLLVSVLRDLAAHQANAHPQDSSLATLAPKITKATTRARWSEKPATELARFTRAFGHQHDLWSTQLLPAIPSRTVPTKPQSIQLRTSPTLVPLSRILTYSDPGTAELDRATGNVVVRCRDAEAGLVIAEVKREGGKWVKAREWYNSLGKWAKEQGVVFE